MDLYHTWFDLKAGVSDVEFARSLDATVRLVVQGSCRSGRAESGSNGVALEIPPCEGVGHG